MQLSASILHSTGQLLWMQKRLSRGRCKGLAKQKRRLMRVITDNLDRVLLWHKNAARIAAVPNGGDVERAAHAVRRSRAAQQATPAAAAWVRQQWLVQAATKTPMAAAQAALEQLLGKDNTELGA